MNKAKVTQVGHRLYITNGEDPVKYLDLTTNKVHVYKTPYEWLYSEIKERMLKIFKQQPMGDFIYWPKTDGFITTDVQPQLLNILETRAENLCRWYDGTFKPVKGHDGSCEWVFDGHIWWHKPINKRRES